MVKIYVLKLVEGLMLCQDYQKHEYRLKNLATSVYKILRNEIKPVSKEFYIFKKEIRFTKYIMFRKTFSKSCNLW